MREEREKKKRKKDQWQQTTHLPLTRAVSK